MKRTLLWIAVSAVLAASPLVAAPDRLPEFPTRKAKHWVNSEPLTVEQLRGEVVLIKVWTFGCVNCTRSLPWVRKIHERYEDEGLRVIGVHTPEFDYEKVPDNVREAVAKYDLSFPHLIDNDFAYWKRLQNRYWPTFYIADKQGNIRLVSIGELHSGTRRAIDAEALITELLAE